MCPGSWAEFLWEDLLEGTCVSLASPLRGPLLTCLGCGRLPRRSGTRAAREAWGPPCVARWLRHGCSAGAPRDSDPLESLSPEADLFLSLPVAVDREGKLMFLTGVLGEARGKPPAAGRLPGLPGPSRVSPLLGRMCHKAHRAEMRRAVCPSDLIDAGVYLLP